MDPRIGRKRLRLVKQRELLEPSAHAASKARPNAIDDGR
jgi:hypothetical protein